MAAMKRTNTGRSGMTPMTTTNEDFIDAQFEDRTPKKVPVKSILMAIGMFVVGSMLIVIGSLLIAGIINPTGDGQIDARATPLLILGAILFIPGSYHTRLAYLAYKGVKGYDYSQIPDMDD